MVFNLFSWRSKVVWKPDALNVQYMLYWQIMSVCTCMQAVNFHQCFTELKYTKAIRTLATVTSYAAS